MSGNLLPWPFGDLAPAGYRLVLADPPWAWKARGATGYGKSPEAHYTTQRLGWIKSLPVRDLAHPDGAACVMWATAPLLPEAVETMRSWGFTFKSAGAWGKQSKTGAKLAFGTGYLYRSAAEFWLLGTIGRPVQTSRSIRNLILAPVREHSRKPDQMHTDLEALFAGPRCELFAREARPGWATWGNQPDHFTAAEAAMETPHVQ